MYITGSQKNPPSEEVNHPSPNRLSGYYNYDEKSETRYCKMAATICNFGHSNSGMSHWNGIYDMPDVNNGANNYNIRNIFPSADMCVPIAQTSNMPQPASMHGTNYNFNNTPLPLPSFMSPYSPESPFPMYSNRQFVDQLNNCLDGSRHSFGQYSQQPPSVTIPKCASSPVIPLVQDSTVSAASSTTVKAPSAANDKTEQVAGQLKACQISDVASTTSTSGSTTTPKSKKRKRTAYTPAQIQGMEEQFAAIPYICNTKREEIAKELSLTVKQIKVWFQNRRMKNKKATGHLKVRGAKRTRSISPQVNQFDEYYERYAACNYYLHHNPSAHQMIPEWQRPPTECSIEQFVNGNCCLQDYKPWVMSESHQPEIPIQTHNPIQQIPEVFKCEETCTSQQSPQNSHIPDQNPQNSHTPQENPQNSRIPQLNPHNNYSPQHNPQNNYNLQHNPQNNFTAQQNPPNNFAAQENPHNNYTAQHYPQNSYTHPHQNPHNNYILAQQSSQSNYTSHESPQNNHIPQQSPPPNPQNNYTPSLQSPQVYYIPQQSPQNIYMNNFYQQVMYQDQ